MTLDDQLRAMIADAVRAEVAKQLAAAREPDEYLSTAEAARLAGVAAGTVRRWIREGRLAEHRAGRVVRVRRADLEAFLRDGRRDRADEPEAAALRDFGG